MLLLPAEVVVRHYPWPQFSKKGRVGNSMECATERLRALGVVEQIEIVSTACRQRVMHRYAPQSTVTGSSPHVRENTRHYNRP